MGRFVTGRKVLGKPPFFWYTAPYG
jgi:hypothetical protein